SPSRASGSWGSHPTVVVAGARSTVPPSGCSSPPRIRSSVDLPMPLGPTMPRRVPAVIDTDTPPSTTCAPWWRTRSRATSTTVDGTGARRRPEGSSRAGSDLEEQRHGAVVHQLHCHVGPEAAGGHGGAEGAQAGDHG